MVSFWSGSIFKTIRLKLQVRLKVHDDLGGFLLGSSLRMILKRLLVRLKFLPAC